MAGRAPRADAVRSRRAIVDAYVTLVRARGGDVPRYEVARAAGVGQGTLYRHFPTRASLAVAVFDSVLTDLEHVAAARVGDPGCFRALLELAFEHQVWMHGLSDVLVRGRDLTLDPELSALTRRTLEVFSGPIAVAQKAGVTREDLTPDDVITMLSMLDGVLGGTGDPDARRRAALRATALLLDGISTRAARASDPGLEVLQLPSDRSGSLRRAPDLPP